MVEVFCFVGIKALALFLELRSQPSSDTTQRIRSHDRVTVTGSVQPHLFKSILFSDLRVLNCVLISFQTVPYIQSSFPNTFSWTFGLKIHMAFPKSIGMEQHLTSGLTWPDDAFLHGGGKWQTCWTFSCAYIPLLLAICGTKSTCHQHRHSTMHSLIVTDHRC